MSEAESEPTFADHAEIDPRHFRDVLGHLPTGVTAVTAHGKDGPVGMAANSVTSVSLDPPLILLCPSKTSETWPLIREAQTFCVNVMAAHHADVTRQLASKDADRFAGISVKDRVAGPALPDAVAWIECRLRDEHDAGDHTIVVAEVLAIEAASTEAAEPLVFFRGIYGSFLPRD
ncbi:MAG: flavin reductase family protein [Actinobacteria bacterium]|nr:flavin reductase family protein [Actinomycetota bacterium]